VLLKPEAKVLLAGGTNESLYLSIHLANGTEIHRVTNQKRSEIFSEKTITLKDYLGEKIYWKVVDQSQDEWGWITVDDIRFNQ